MFKSTVHRHDQPHTHAGGHQHPAHGPAQLPQGPALPLALAGQGCCVRVCGVRANPETARHLENLGFVPGGEVAVMCENGGSLIVDVKGARVALSRQMAGKIMVNA
jgi:ferrous iron transport protein A